MAAAALFYLEHNEADSYRSKGYSDVMQFFYELNPQIKEPVLHVIYSMLEKFRKGEQLDNIYCTEQVKDAVNY